MVSWRTWPPLPGSGHLPGGSDARHARARLSFGVVRAFAAVDTALPEGLANHAQHLVFEAHAPSRAASGAGQMAAGEAPGEDLYVATVADRAGRVLTVRHQVSTAGSTVSCMQIPC